MRNEPKFPNKYLIIGAVTFIVGGLFLLWTLGFLPSFKSLWPLPLIIFGMLLIYLVIFHRRRDVYLVIGMILSLCGIFFLLINIIPEKNLAKIWPGFMLITGISLLPYAFRKKQEKYKIAIIIPAWCMIILSCIFFLFSLNILGVSFQVFVSKWWPVLIIILGISFIVLFYYSKKKKRAK
jgi:drug/metabolite transporter (DMT)-like permease